MLRPHRESTAGGRVGRRRFLRWLAAFPFVPAAVARAAAPSPVGDAMVLRRRRRHPDHAFAPFPRFAETGIYGAGTYQMGSPELLTDAVAGGVRLVDTSPDYRDGDAEHAVGGVLKTVPQPVFVMTQIPVDAWRYENRAAAFHRALRQSLGRLDRPGVEALLVRNAEPDQIQDPEFRRFAEEARDRGLVERIGASGHGTDLETVLEIAVEDPLIEIVLFGAHLAGFGRIPELLPPLRERGVLLVAMKSREAAFYDRMPGWEDEDARRRHRPWDGAWDPEFTRRALARAAELADNAVLSLRRDDDARAVLGAEPVR
jgi:aryl-alcohol dehydrogenase-like predicted oxidoreductase